MNESLPATLTRRQLALARLEDFLPKAIDYHAKRNFVVPGHENVSQLSPALRVRLLTEYEVLDRVWDHYGLGTAETFEKEVWWRVYWKGWLEKRPAVWDQYRDDLKEIEESDRSFQIVSGNSGVAIMDHFTRELIETGYLHNHARMWWSAWWIHIEKLPWQLGADFFLRHLLDGDAASNTLSWRWVAGLHTRGKEYLPRRSNLEKFITHGLLNVLSRGLECFESPEALGLPFVEPPEAIDLYSLPQDSIASIPATSSIGIWLHDEDLHLESSPIAQIQESQIKAIAATVPDSLWTDEQYSPAKRSYLEAAIQDGLERASDAFSAPGEDITANRLAQSLVEWAQKKSLDTIVTMQPFVGPLREKLSEIDAALRETGIDLRCLHRPEDREAMNFATAGFFSFWKKTTRLRKERFRERNQEPASSQ